MSNDAPAHLNDSDADLDDNVSNCCTNDDSTNCDSDSDYVGSERGDPEDPEDPESDDDEEEPDEAESDEEEHGLVESDEGFDSGEESDSDEENEKVPFNMRAELSEYAQSLFRGNGAQAGIMACTRFLRHIDCNDKLLRPALISGLAEQEGEVDPLVVETAAEVRMLVAAKFETSMTSPDVSSYRGMPNVYKRPAAMLDGFCALLVSRVEWVPVSQAIVNQLVQPLADIVTGAPTAKQWAEQIFRNTHLGTVEPARFLRLCLGGAVHAVMTAKKDTQYALFWVGNANCFEPRRGVLSLAGVSPSGGAARVLGASKTAPVPEGMVRVVLRELTADAECHGHITTINAHVDPKVKLNALMRTVVGNPHFPEIGGYIGKKKYQVMLEVDWDRRKDTATFVAADDPAINQTVGDRSSKAQPEKPRRLLVHFRFIEDPVKDAEVFKQVQMAGILLNNHSVSMEVDDSAVESLASCLADDLFDQATAISADTITVKYFGGSLREYVVPNLHKKKSRQMFMAKAKLLVQFIRVKVNSKHAARLARLRQVARCFAPGISVSVSRKHKM